MRKILIIFAFLLSAFNAFADGMSANDIVLTDDKQSMLDISLSNTSAGIVGLQFNLALPEGVTPVMDGDRVAIEPSGRLRGSYSLKGKKVADGSYLFTFLSNDRTPIDGKSGKLLSIALQNTALLPIGSYEANISGVTISDINGNEQSSADASFSITVLHSYKLIYKVDGAVYKEYTLTNGTAITPEPEPTKEGYTFSGWSEIPATMPAHDVEVNGSYIINKYKVTFISEGTVIKEETLAYGSPITAPANPTKAGHSFTGWNPAIDATVPAHDVTYTAQFSVNQYTITFDTDGGSYVAPITQNYGTAVTKPVDPTKEGYTFSGWSPAIPATMPAENMTIKAQWSVNSYKLTYKVDGNVYKEYTLNYGAAITPEAAPVKEGYTFSGWSEIPATMPAHDVEVTGSFTKGAYKLTYYIDGTKYKEMSYDYGAAITPEAEPTKEGYTFSGWSEIPATMPAHDVEVNGSFTVNKYKVTFISDGTVIKEETLAYGSPITAPANPVKVGHTFTGWNPTVDATVPAHDVTYVAQFSINQYTITFDTDGGSYVAPITQNYGTAVTKPVDPTKEGYTFSGWSPAIPATMPAENMTIKAQWSVNSYKLTYKVDGNVYKEYTLNFGAAITPEAEPAKEGYTFSGWSEIPTTMPAHDVEVNGSFEVNIYNIYYYVDEELVHQDEVAFGETFELWIYEPDDNDLIFNGWIGEMYDTMPSHDISYKADITNGIAKIYNNPEAVQGIFTLDGKQVEKMSQGVYVVRMKDGSTKKIINNK